MYLMQLIEYFVRISRLFLLKVSSASLQIANQELLSKFLELFYLYQYFLLEFSELIVT